jgi:hypothetical protein
LHSTHIPPGNLAESDSSLNARCPALPQAEWRITGSFLHRRMLIMGKIRPGRLLLLSATLGMAVALLVFSGCAGARNAVSPAPTLSGGGGTLVATLTPEGTNTHGSGTARLQFNPDQQTICAVIQVTGIELPATAAHIHRGAKGTVGPIVVHLLSPNARGVSTGCMHVPRSLITAILQDPADYYVNVHNMPYPDGAVRGQLGV